MESRKWMDLDGSWVYSTTPRRHPDSHYRYNTLPGRKSMDILRRPFDERGVYGTIPGSAMKTVRDLVYHYFSRDQTNQQVERFVDRRGLVGDQSPYRSLSASRFPPSSILQDSTNWPPPAPSGIRSTKMVRMEEKIDAQRDHRRKYDRRIYDEVRHSEDLERKKRKLLREAEAEMMNISSDKHGQKLKSVEKDTIYEQSVYSRYQKPKESQYEEWERVSPPPKALQAQMTTQRSKLLPSHPGSQSNREKPHETNAPVQEKKRWWFKSPKQLKQAIPEVTVMDNLQGDSHKKSLDQSTLAIYDTQTVHSSKENQPKMRKRKVPPPYVPPPSYNSPHLTFPISKDKHNHTDGKSLGEITRITNRKTGEKMARFAIEHTNTNLNLPSSINLNRVQANNTHRSEPIYQHSIWDRRLPQIYSTWGGQRSKWSLNQAVSGDYEFLDHIYETVEGQHSPLNVNIPDERTYGTISTHQKKDHSKEYTLPTRGNGDVIKTGKKSKITANGESHKIPQFDVHRPSLRSHGAKLPYELGFSYTSGKSQFPYKRMSAKYKTLQDLEEDDVMNEKRRPLRVISSKERRLHNHIPFPSKEEYGWYSQTLPLKKSSHGQMKMNMQEKMPTHSLKYRNSSDDVTFPKLKELGKIRTLPSRGDNRNPRTGNDGRDRNVKYSLSEHSEMQSPSAPRKSQLKKDSVEKLQSVSSKDNGGMFVIDATCVVVKAEYIFPPQTEQVKFISYPEDPQDMSKKKSLSNQGHLGGNAKEKPISLHDSQSKSNMNIPTNYYPHNPRAESPVLFLEKHNSNLKERALRILGLSMVELESLKGGQALHETTKLTEWDTEILEETHCKREQLGEQELRSCTGPSCNVTAGVNYLATKSLRTREDKQPFNKSLPDRQSGEENLKPEPKQKQSDCSIEARNMESDPTITSILTFSLENKSNKIDSSNIPETVQSALQNYITSSEIELEARENISDMINTPHQNDVPTGMDFQVATNRRPCDNTKHVSDDSIVNSTFNVQTNDEMPEQKICPLKDLVTEETNTEPCCDTDHEGNGQLTSKTYSEHSKKPIHLTGRSAPDSLCMKSNSQKTNAKLISNHPSPGTPETPIKPYTKRPNYFAKDLREAVSRIRRHTAPDSDTDEELEKPLQRSFLESPEVNRRSVTSCSSDTSDSEVTVILCDGNKDELASEIDVTEGSPEPTGIANRLNDIKVTREESTSVGSTGDNRPDESVSPEAQQESSCLDLNSCIEKILQDLSRTEEEFFPLSSNKTVVVPTSLEHRTE